MQPYISVYRPIAGYRSICYIWDKKYQYYMPQQTGDRAYSTKEEAVAEAKVRAACEGLEYQD